MRRLALLLASALAACSQRAAEPPTADGGSALPAPPDVLALVARIPSPELAFVLGRGAGLLAHGREFTSPGDLAAQRGELSHLAARFPADLRAPFEVDLARMSRLRVTLRLIEARPAPGRLVEGRVVYEGAFPDTDVIALSGNEFAEQLLVLHGPGAPRAFAWDLQLGKGLHPRPDADGSSAIVLADARNEGVLRIVAPWVVDTNGNKRLAAMTLDGARLSISIDPTGLVYPIVLDPAIEQHLWEKVATTGPVARRDGALVYDPDRKVTVLAAGLGPSGFDTWEWSGAGWTQRCGPPPATSCGAAPFAEAPAMAYHATAKKMNLTFRLAGSDPTAKVAHQGLWNGTSWTWTSWTYPAAPNPVYQHRAVYDPGSDRIVRAGGYGWSTFGGVDTEYPKGETSGWNGSTWSILVTDATGSPFKKRRSFAMGLDPLGRILAFGGDVSDSVSGVKNDTLVFSAGAWTALTPGTSPTARKSAAMVYDSIRKRTVMFGGLSDASALLDEHWEWNGTNWILLSPLVKPSARFGASLAFDSARGRAILFGGGISSGSDGETWELHARGGGCASDAECDTGHCVDSVCCETASCGACQACNQGATPGTCMAVVGGDDVDSCAAPTSTCNGAGTCVKLDGQACTTGSECKSTFCADGVCCSTACTETCYACRADLKTIGKDSGVCGPAKDGGNPRASCTAGPSGGCGQTGTCDGGGKCKLQPAGTSCGSGLCDSGTYKGQQCDGAGACVANPTGTACAPGVCATGSGCRLTCASNADCDAGGFCDTTVAPSLCKSKKPNGAVCGNGSMCASGFCVDGVCCNAKCDELCQACSAATKQSATGDGVCGAARDGANPHADCAKDTSNACGNLGVCNGAGACKLAAAGTGCGAGVCDGNTFKGQQCNGLGACTSNPSGTLCTPGLCVGGAGCKSTCKGPGDCVDGAFCDLSVTPGLCKSKRPNGDACAGNGECSSGFCVDSVCCNSACDETCQACAAKSKQSASGDGICGAAKEGQNPHGDCAAGKGGACGQTGACDGAGKCKLAIKGAACGAIVCDLGTSKGQQCDGLGVCTTDATGTSCAPGACKAGRGCDDACTKDEDCSGGAFCDAAGKCSLRKKNGETCGRDQECQNPFCVDGVCCNRPCDGQCEACDADKAAGTCVPILGKPHGARKACDAAPSGQPCREAVCNGVDVDACVGFVGSAVVCRAARCEAGSAESEARCDGKGGCPADPPKACEPYACAGTTCGATCAGDNECAPGSRCAGGKCINAGVCDGDHTVTSADGATTTNCSPFRCDASGQCITTCKTSDDCIAAYVCGTGVCVPGAPPTVEEGGCAVVASGRAGGGSVLLLLLCGLARRPKRRATSERTEGCGGASRHAL